MVPQAHSKLLKLERRSIVAAWEIIGVARSQRSNINKNFLSCGGPAGTDGRGARQNKVKR